MNSSTTHRYHPAAIWLHWLMFLLLIAVYGFIEFRELFEKGTEPRELMKTIHFMLGLCVLLLVSARIFTRLTNAVPPIVPTLAAWQRAVSALIHFLLYVWMVTMPILGWLMLSAADKTIPFFGLELPALIGADKEFAKTLKGIHEWLGVAGYWLIGLHVVAGLFHHLVQRDNTLLRMLPGKRG